MRIIIIMVYKSPYKCMYLSSHLLPLVAFFVGLLVSCQMESKLCARHFHYKGTTTPAPATAFTFIHNMNNRTRIQDKERHLNQSSTRNGTTAKNTACTHKKNDLVELIFGRKVNDNVDHEHDHDKSLFASFPLPSFMKRKQKLFTLELTQQQKQQKKYKHVSASRHNILVDVTNDTNHHRLDLDSHDKHQAHIIFNAVTAFWKEIIGPSFQQHPNTSAPTSIGILQHITNITHNYDVKFDTENNIHDGDDDVYSTDNTRGTGIAVIPNIDDVEKNGHENNFVSKKKQHKRVHIVHNIDDDYKNNNNNSNGSEIQENKKNHTKSESFTILHKFYHPPTNVTLYGLNVSLSKFKAWVAYTLQINYDISDLTTNTFKCFDNEKVLSSSTSISISISNLKTDEIIKEISPYVTSENIVITSERRIQLRSEWYARRLISDRTEVLASYASNNQLKKNHNGSDGCSTQQRNDQRQSLSSNMKRGGFDDLLRVYADRLVSIVMEELSNDHLKPTRTVATVEKDSILTKIDIAQKNSTIHTLQNGNNTITPRTNAFDLVAWLRMKYDTNEIDKLLYTNFSKLSEKDQLHTLQNFLNWFKEKFPYYYDKCDGCHASYRDDERNHNLINQDTVPHHNNDESVIDDESDETDDNQSDGTFLGYVFPSRLEEIEGKASRTELYRCHKCSAYTRFPRFNSISSIVKLGRGRCGEYSILLYRMLRDLGHSTRWVVDWADHVWVECWIPSQEHKDKGRWMHLDPCEAACDQPYLYQQWGKKQTMIIAFWLPGSKFHQLDNYHQQLLHENCSPLIEDVTSKYTSDTLEVIQSRREETIENINISIQEVEANLRDSLSNIRGFCQSVAKKNLISKSDSV